MLLKTVQSDEFGKSRKGKWVSLSVMEILSHILKDCKTVTGENKRELRV